MSSRAKSWQTQSLKCIKFSLFSCGQVISEKRLGWLNHKRIQYYWKYQRPQSSSVQGGIWLIPQYWLKIIREWLRPGVHTHVAQDKYVWKSSTINPLGTEYIGYWVTVVHKMPHVRTQLNGDNVIDNCENSSQEITMQMIIVQQKNTKNAPQRFRCVMDILNGKSRKRLQRDPKAI